MGPLAKSVPALAVAGAIAVLTATPHVAAGYVTVRSEVTLQRVFADEPPSDVLPARGVFLGDRTAADLAPELPRSAPLPAGRLSATRDVLVQTYTPLERPWVTILLVGSDEGPGRAGDRTDTMILAGLERDTGRAVAFGIPRNLVNVRLGGRAGEELRRFPDLLNALYRFANEERPDLFPGGRDPGATALKQTVSRLLGLRVDYHAMVDLDGFRDLVDALGGVKIRVRERIFDEVTRPAWGETNPRINVYPAGPSFRRGTALAYVRSRKDSDDYTRMHRQRCFLTAMANQLDVVSVLRNFGTLASIVESSVRTDIPRDQLPDLIRLIGRLDPSGLHGQVRPQLHRAPARARPFPDRKCRRDAHDGARGDPATAPGHRGRRRDRPPRLLKAALSPGRCFWLSRKTLSESYARLSPGSATDGATPEQSRHLSHASRAHACGFGVATLSREAHMGFEP